MKKNKPSKKIKSFVFYLILSLAITLIAVFSSFITMNVISLCFNEVKVSHLLEFLCGNIGKSKEEFVLLKPDDILRIYSNDILEINENSKVEKLIDGDINTGAYPGNKGFDYIIELIDEYEINRVELVWGSYGSIDNYIQEWSLEAKTNGILGKWAVILGAKTSPEAEKTVVNKSFKADAIRIHAKSQDNWIGILEVKILRKS